MHMSVTQPNCNTQLESDVIQYDIWAKRNWHFEKKKEKNLPFFFNFDLNQVSK